MAAGGNILLRFLLLQSLVMVALCCSCERTHLQEQFCKHEYVVKGLIKAGGYSLNKKTYVLDLKKIYKGDRGKLTLKRGRYLLIIMPRSCAVDSIKYKDTFLFFGSLSDGHISTNLCSGSTKWRNTSPIVRRFLRNKYKSGCDCVSEAGEYDSCRWQYSYLKKVDGQCKWTKSLELTRCQGSLIPTAYNTCWA